MEIFCDMENVFADMDRAVLEVLGKRRNHMLEEDLWCRLEEAVDFFCNLRWCADGEYLWKFLKSSLNAKLTILTRCKNCWVASGKKQWCERELGAGVRFIKCQKTFSSRVKKCVFISRSIRCRSAWEASGGIYIEHRSAIKTIAVLRCLTEIDSRRDMMILDTNEPAYLLNEPSIASGGSRGAFECSGHNLELNVVASDDKRLLLDDPATIKEQATAEISTADPRYLCIEGDLHVLQHAQVTGDIIIPPDHEIPTVMPNDIGSYDDFRETVNALVMLGSVDHVFFSETVSFGDTNNAHRVRAAAFASKILNFDGIHFENYCVEVISLESCSGRGGEFVTIPSATAVTDSFFEPIRLAYLNYSLGYFQGILNCDMVTKSLVSGAEGCKDKLLPNCKTTEESSGGVAGVAIFEGVTASLNMDVGTRRDKALSNTIDKRMVIRSPFQNLKHLKSFDAAQRWREEMIAATKANKEMQKAVSMPTAAWRRSNRLLMGGAGRLLRTVVSGLDELMGNLAVCDGAAAGGSGSSAAGAMRVTSNKSASLRSKDGFGSTVSSSALRLSGIAFDWNDADMLQCDEEFKYAQLHHLLPIWPIACGLCIFMDELAKEAKTFRDSHPQVFSEGLEISVNLSLMLLRTKQEYRLLPSSASGSGSTSSSTSSTSSSSSSSSTSRTPISTMTHAFDALSALRGHCWEKLLSYLAAAGHDNKTLDAMWRKALDDPYISSEARVSLAARKADLANDHWSYRAQHQRQQQFWRTGNTADTHSSTGCNKFCCKKPTRNVAKGVHGGRGRGRGRRGGRGRGRGGRRPSAVLTCLSVTSRKRPLDVIQEGEENAEEAAEADAASAVGGREGVDEEEEEEETPDLTPDQKRVRPEALTARVTAVATAAASSSSACGGGGGGGGGVSPMLPSPLAFSSTNEASHEDLRWLEAQGALKGLSGVHLATDEEISSLSLPVRCLLADPIRGANVAQSAPGMAPAWSTGFACEAESTNFIVNASAAPPVAAPLEAESNMASVGAKPVRGHSTEEDPWLEADEKKEAVQAAAGEAVVGCSLTAAGNRSGGSGSGRGRRGGGGWGRRLQFEVPAMRCQRVGYDWGGLEGGNHGGNQSNSSETSAKAAAKGGCKGGMNSQSLGQYINVEQLAAIHYLDEIAGEKGQVNLRLFGPPAGAMATVSDPGRGNFGRLGGQFFAIEQMINQSACSGFYQATDPVTHQALVHDTYGGYNSSTASSTHELMAKTNTERGSDMEASVSSVMWCPEDTRTSKWLPDDFIAFNISSRPSRLSTRLGAKPQGEDDEVEFCGFRTAHSAAQSECPEWSTWASWPAWPLVPNMSAMAMPDLLSSCQIPRDWVAVKGKVLGMSHRCCDDSGSFVLEAAPAAPAAPAAAAKGEKKEEAWAVCWSESKLWVNIIMLLFWEQIFDPAVPYALLRPFQNKPLDFVTAGTHCSWIGGGWGWGDLPPARCEAFYPRRKRAMVARMQALTEMAPQQIAGALRSAYEQHFGAPCWGVNWDSVDIEEASSLASAIGGRRLSVVAEAFLRTPETLYRGMPDLLFWRVSPHGAPGGEKSGAAATAVGKGSSTRLEPWEADSVFAVEVKSSNDRLSRWQVLWLELLVKAGIPVEILKVQPSEAHG